MNLFNKTVTKRKTACILLVLLIFNLFSLLTIGKTVELNDDSTSALKVYVNSKKLSSAKVSPYKSGKGYLVPAKKFVKLLKVKYKYKKAAKLIVLKKKSKKMYLTINKKKAVFKKKNIKLKVKTRLKSGTPMIDAVTVAKKFGYKYSKYFKDSNTLIVANKKKYLKNPGLADNHDTTMPPSNTMAHPTNTANPDTTVMSGTTPNATSTPELKPTVVPSSVATFVPQYSRNFEDGSTLFTEFYNGTPTQQTNISGGANGTNKALSLTASWLTCRSFPELTLQTNTDYKVSFYIKGKVYQVILIMPDDTRYTICNYADAPEITEWRKVEYSFSTGSALGTERDFEFRIVTGEGTMYLDELVFEAKTNVTVYVTITPTLPPPPTPTPPATPKVYPSISIDPEGGKEGTTYAYRTTGLPVCFINTNNKSNPTKKGVYQEGLMCIEDTGTPGTRLLQPLKIQIAVRGNSTSSAPKKPYNIKFMPNDDGSKNKQSVLGMSAHHKWNMLANYYDKSLLRNAVALQFAEQLDGLDYTPDFRFVEVVLNGEYVGHYMITEKVEIADKRVNIKKDNGDGGYGYIIENDKRSPDFEISGIGNEGAMRFAFKDPDSEDLSEDGNNTRRNYIQNDVTSTWQNIYASTTYNQITQYIDIDSFVDYHIVQDFAMPVDGYFSSIEMYKNSQGDTKLHMGPVWDYDLAFGNSNPDQVSSLLFRWTDYLNPVFGIAECRTLRTQRWNNYAKSIANSMVTYLDETAAYIKKSAELNNKRWPLTSDSYYGGAIVHNNNDEEVAYFRSQLVERINYIDGMFNIGWY